MKTSPDDPLREALSHLHPAPSSDAVRERSLALSLAALREGQRSSGPASVLSRLWQAGQENWGWLAAAACLAVALLLVLPRTHVSKPDGIGLVFGQIEALFPSQLDSVIVSPEGVTVNTSETPTTTYADQRIRLVLSKSGDEAADVQVVTYSGRRVCLQLPGRKLCLTPMLTGDGGVMVVTDSQVFQQDSALLAPGYQLHMSPMKEVTL